MSDELVPILQRALGPAYTLERELGGGGMSRVYLAREHRLDRRVVVKLLAPALAQGVSAERFEREIRHIAALQHPHIVPILAAGEAGGLPFYTMPFVEGESLRRRLEEQGPLSIPEAVRLLRDVARALAYAHSRGLVHRDIKPENVLLSGGAAMLADFGVAKAIRNSTLGDQATGLTSAGMALGTPAYMAPEQALGDPEADHRADLYAFGAMAYECLTGLVPFAGRSAQGMIAAHLTLPPPPLTGQRGDLPPPLDALIMQCLAKMPEDRPPSAAGLQEVLEALPASLSWQEQSGHFPPGSYTSPRRQPVLSRRWVAAVIAGAGVVALAIALSVTNGRRVSGGGSTGRVESARVAVLTFEANGSDADTSFADGVAEAISNRLSHVASIGVIDQASIRTAAATEHDARRLGQALGATYVLRGSVRSAHQDGRTVVRVSPALLRVEDGMTHWAPEPFIVDPQESFRVHAQISEAIANALGLVLATRERAALAAPPPTTDADALEDFRRGEEYERELRRSNDGSVRGAQLAADRYRSAVRRDPQFAMARVRFADVLIHLGFLTNTAKEAQHAAAAQIDTALRLDPGLAEAFVLRAELLEQEGRLASAEVALRDALNRRPSDPHALVSLVALRMRRGDTTGVFGQLVRALQLAPRDNELLMQATDLARDYRRFDLAERWAARAVELDPAHSQALVTLARVLVDAHGDTTAAYHLLDSAMLRLPDPPMYLLVAMAYVSREAWPRLLDLELSDLALADASDSVMLWDTKAQVLRALGRVRDARRYFERVRATATRLRTQEAPNPYTRYTLGTATAALGDSVAAREHLAALAALPSEDVRAWSYQPLMWRAEVHAMLGETAQAIELLEDLLRLPSGITRHTLRSVPMWQALRGQPEFERLLAGSDS